MDMSRGMGWGSHQSVSFKHLEVTEDPERKSVFLFWETLSRHCTVELSQKLF